MSIGCAYFLSLVIFRQCLYNDEKTHQKEGASTNRYREARIKAGLSQKAAAISLGVKPPSMSDWESGKSKPTHTHLIAMAALYNTTTDYLTGASDTEKKQPTASGDGLANDIISRIQDLSDPELDQVAAFLSGLAAGRGISSSAEVPPATSEALSE